MLKDIDIKLRTLFLPFLVLAITIVSGYIFLRWIFEIKLGVLHLKKDLLDYWLPVIIPWIPMLIWYRKRVRLLNVRGKNDNGYTFYQFIFCAFISASIISGQNLVKDKSYDLVEIENSSELKKFNNEKFFKISRYHIDRKMPLTYINSRVSGRHNEDLNFYMYVVCPFKNSVNTWLGIKYSKRVSNRMADEDKNVEYNSFYTDSFREFQRFQFNQIQYFEKEAFSDDWDGFKNAINSEGFNIQNPIILVPKTEVFQKNTSSSLNWLLGVLGFGLPLITLMIFIPSLNKRNYSDFKKGKEDKNDPVKYIIEHLNPFGPYKFSGIILSITILYFMIMVFAGVNFASPTSKELAPFGALRSDYIQEGQYWRFITYIFIHAGFLHLMMNLLGFGIAVNIIRTLIKPTQLIIVYLICGIGAGLISLHWNDHITIVGASGAIFGLYGMILAFIVFKVFSEDMAGFSLIMLLLFPGITLLLGFIGFFGSIDNAGHVGGLICGFLIGAFYAFANREGIQR